MVTRTSWSPQAVAWPIHSPEEEPAQHRGARSGSWPDWLLRLCGNGAGALVALPEREAPARRFQRPHPCPAVAVDGFLTGLGVARRYRLTGQRPLGDGLVQGLLTPVGGHVEQAPWV